MKLRYMPCQIVARLIRALSLGTDPTLAGDWSVFVSQSAPEPINQISVFDTTPVQYGRTGPDSEVQLTYGIQIKVRGKDVSEAFTRVNDIAFALASVHNTIISIDAEYPVTVHAVTRQNGPLPIGTEQPEGVYSLFTLNVLVTLTQDEEL